IVKSCICSALSGIGIEHPRWPRPVNGSHTHGAGLTRGIYFAIFQLKRLEAVTCIADGYDFRMGGWVICASHTVEPFPYHFSILYNYTAKGAAVACLHSLS